MRKFCAYDGDPAPTKTSNKAVKPKDRSRSLFKIKDKLIWEAKENGKAFLTNLDDKKYS